MISPWRKTFCPFFRVKCRDKSPKGLAVLLQLSDVLWAWIADGQRKTAIVRTVSRRKMRYAECIKSVGGVRFSPHTDADQIAVGFESSRIEVSALIRIK